MPPDAPGFSHFCPGHLVWLGSALALCAALWIFYSRWGAGKRRLCRRILAALLVCDELFKYGIALHLCSINIFLIAADVIRPNQRLREVLYAVCLPGAFFALLFPGWNYLPLWNALCIHSFTAHLLLLLYPLLLIAGGFRPDIRRFAGTLPAALTVVGLVYCFNRLFASKFVFLRLAAE